MLEQPKMPCKAEKKEAKSSLTRKKKDISVDGKSKNCGTAGKENKGEGEIKSDNINLLTLQKVKMK